MKTYDVHVTREDDHWVANVPDVPGANTDAKSLATLRRSVREVITLMADYPDSAVDDETAFGVAFRVEEHSNQVEGDDPFPPCG